MLSKDQKIAAFKLSYCFAMADAAKKRYVPKSRMWNKWSNLEDHIGRVLDEYRIEALPVEDLDKASALFDVLDEKIREMWG